MLGEDAARPVELVLVRPERAVDDLDLRRVDAGLAAQAERAGAAAGLLQPAGVVERQVDGVERGTDPGRDGIDHELRTRVEQLVAVCERREAELRGEVDRAEQQRDHAGHARDLKRAPHAVGGLGDRDDRQPLGGELLGRLRRRLREHEPGHVELANGLEVGLEQAALEPVHAHERARGQRAREQRAGRVLALRRDAVLEVDHDGVRARSCGGGELALVVAGDEEERAPGSRRHRRILAAL